MITNIVGSDWLSLQEVQVGLRGEDILVVLLRSEKIKAGVPLDKAIEFVQPLASLSPKHVVCMLSDEKGEHWDLGVVALAPGQWSTLIPFALWECASKKLYDLLSRQKVPDWTFPNPDGNSFCTSL